MSNDFESILAAAQQAANTSAPPSGSPLTDALEFFRRAVGATTNLGESGDESDLYTVVDNIAQSVRDSYAGTVCRMGCSGCCDSPTAVFDVSLLEWRLIRAYIRENWTREQWQNFTSRFEREHLHRLGTYRFLHTIWHFEPIADHVWRRNGYRCPFLLGGACSIYSVRPLACRMYGFFALVHRSRPSPTVYGCRLQADHFEKMQSEQHLQLPAARTVWFRHAKLTRQPFWRINAQSRILPLWIAADRALSSDGCGMMPV
ncbi:MAG: YkgJ family cysteine cluster protein [Candidatus Sericytochromatia bacterium]|nr:YkgJ family cysteine cluster protein [Candidatus Sericytochromatia bacterium]